MLLTLILVIPSFRPFNSKKSLLYNWLNAKAVHWKQRSRIRWLQDDDRNTKFFHLSAKSRSIWNRIDSISVGDTLFKDEEQIRDQACIHFSKLLQSSFSIPDESLFNMAGPSVKEEQNGILVAIPSATKIRDAVFGLKRNVAPGPDGFSDAFFTNCWVIVGSDVIKVVSHFFTSDRLLRESNAYFLTLMPKIQSPKFFPSSFQTINLPSSEVDLIITMWRLLMIFSRNSRPKSQAAGFV